MTKQIKHCVVVSDLHPGCQLGLCPPKVRNDEDGYYHHSPIQAKTWAMWGEFWKWVDKEVAGEPYHVVVNGDSINGQPHGSTNNWTDNITTQVQAARTILQPIRDKCPGKFFMVRGTSSHVGKSAEGEEHLAELLNAHKSTSGAYSHWELWLQVGGYTVHFLHHIGTCSSTAYKSSALMSEMSSMLVNSALIGQKPPHTIVRSHRHSCVEVRLPYDGGVMTCVTTPAWQCKTPFAHRVPGARVEQPEIGGILLKAGDEGIYCKPKIWRLERPKLIV